MAARAASRLPRALRRPAGLAVPSPLPLAPALSVTSAPHLPSTPRAAHPPATRRRTSSSASAASAAAAAAKQIASDGAWVASLGLRVGGHILPADPFRLAASELDALSSALLRTVKILQQPSLDAAAAHLLSLRGKRVRPTIVILMARAAGALQCGAPAPAGGILPSQRRLAEITELIHAASLLHDDVIDAADRRRGAPSANSVFGNQLAVLAGDFLLARASVALARLRDCDVVEALSTVIEHLVRGEVIQMRGASASDAQDDASADAAARYANPSGRFETYLAKTFFKTASLIANSSRAVVMLAGHDKHATDAAYAYGEHVGIAFQLVDDVLDMVGDGGALGKPVCDDLRQGHATAPVLFALERFPEMGAMVDRRFRGQGDVEAARRMVEEADGVERTRELAAEHARKGVTALCEAMPPTEARAALVNLADIVLSRSK